MKLTKIYILALSIFCIATAQAQKKSPAPKKDWTKVDLSNRNKDHLMFQVGYHMWTSRPDSIATSGIGRSFNAYFMFDFPFKTDARWSVGMGPGISTDNIYFDKQVRRRLDIVNNNALTYAELSARDTGIRYRKVKLATAFLEVPVELRFNTDPENDKGLKAALGLKVGTMINVMHRTRYQSDARGNLDYIEKLKSRQHFNNLRIAATGRIGFGKVAIFASYQLNDLIKERQGPNQIRPLTVGLSISGL